MSPQSTCYMYTELTEGFLEIIFMVLLSAYPETALKSTIAPAGSMHLLLAKGCCTRRDVWPERRPQHFPKTRRSGIVVRASVGCASKVSSKHGDHDGFCCPSSFTSCQKVSLACMLDRSDPQQSSTKARWEYQGIVFRSLEYQHCSQM